jgi:hypothetical protein
LIIVCYSARNWPLNVYVKSGIACANQALMPNRGYLRHKKDQGQNSVRFRQPIVNQQQLFVVCHSRANFALSHLVGRSKERD